MWSTAQEHEFVLPHTGVVNREDILKSIDSLHPEGVTNVEDGIHKGYELASKNAEEGCINRVILCSDGVANEGVTDSNMLLKEIRDYVEEDDIYLTTVRIRHGQLQRYPYGEPCKERERQLCLR